MTDFDPVAMAERNTRLAAERDAAIARAEAAEKACKLLADDIDDLEKQVGKLEDKIDSMAERIEELET